MKRAGFTMIELIFVIVILGILAAVAIPKLAATRDDAKISKLAANLSTIITDAGAFYTSQGNTRWNAVPWSDVTNVELAADAQVVGGTATLESDPGTGCFTVAGTADGNITVTTIGVGNTICDGAAEIAGTKTAPAPGVDHRLGGQGVVR
jgi:prepilin-type N-terminal cleavage/methylation domain-containing protein